LQRRLGTPAPGPPPPGRFTLFQEGRHAFARFLGAATRGDAFDGVGDQGGVDGAAGKVAHQPLAGLDRVGAVGAERAAQRVDRLAQPISGNDVMQQAEAQRGGGVKPFSRQEVAVRRAFAHGADHVRADGGR